MEKILASLAAVFSQNPLAVFIAASIMAGLFFIICILIGRFIGRLEMNASLQYIKKKQDQMRLSAQDLFFQDSLESSLLPFYLIFPVIRKTQDLQESPLILQLFPVCLMVKTGRVVKLKKFYLQKLKRVKQFFRSVKKKLKEQSQKGGFVILNTGSDPDHYLSV